MSAKRATLSKPFITNFAFIRSLASVSPSMFNKILPGAKCLSAEFTDFRLLACVYPNVDLHVLPSNQFPTDFASHLTLSGVRPKMFLVAVAVKSLESTYLAFVFLPGLRLTVNFHVTPQVNPVRKGFVANFTSARLVVCVHAHVGLQGRLQVKSFVTDLAKFRELLIVSPDVNLQVILRRQLGTANVADVRSAMQSLVDVQILLFLEKFVADVALDRSRSTVTLLLLSLQLTRLALCFQLPLFS